MPAWLALHTKSAPVWFPSFFPVHAVWFAGLWQIIGAGAATLSSVTFVIVADLCPPDQRYARIAPTRRLVGSTHPSRTAAFSHIQSASLISQFLFTPVGAFMMTQGPWIPVFISSAIMIVGFGVAVLFVPETLNIQDVADDSQESVALPKTSAHHHPLKLWDDVRALGRWLTQNASLVVVLSAFYAFHLGEQSGGPLLLQYTSRRLGWTLGEVK